MEPWHASPFITINNEMLEVPDHVICLGSTIISNLYLDSTINKRINKPVSVMARLRKRVWSNVQQTVNTKLKVYRAWVLSRLFYSSKACPIYTKQNNRLKSFHLHCLQCILNIKRQDRIINATVPEQACSLSLHLLCLCWLHWLGHEDGPNPKDMMQDVAPNVDEQWKMLPLFCEIPGCQWLIYVHLYIYVYININLLSSFQWIYRGHCTRTLELLSGHEALQWLWLH